MSVNVHPVAKRLENQFRNYNIDLLAYSESDMAKSRFRVSWRYEGIDGSVLHYEEQDNDYENSDEIPEEDIVDGQNETSFMVYYQESDRSTVRVDSVSEVVDEILN